MSSQTEIKIVSLDSGNFLVNEKFLPLLEANGVKSAENVWRLGGETVKQAIKERGTERIELKGSGVPVELYLKRYLRRPLREVVKSAFSLKFKDFDAIEEWESLLAFHRLGFPTIMPVAVAKCREGSCSLTLGVKNFERAADLYPALKDQPERRRALIVKLARLAAAMHSADMAHQDFYLAHVFILPGDELCLIDLQRVLRQRGLAQRWMVKDVSQMLFSARPHAQPGDIALFLRTYAKARHLKLDELKDLARACDTKSDSIAEHDAKLAARRGKGR